MIGAAASQRRRLKYQINSLASSITSTQPAMRTA